MRHNRLQLNSSSVLNHQFECKVRMNPSENLRRRQSPAPSLAPIESITGPAI